MNAPTGSPDVQRDALMQEWYQGQDLSEFPSEDVRTSTELYRAHLAGWGAVYYATYPSYDGGRGGRFDLPPGRQLGTCYMATDQLTTLRERFGPRLLHASILPRKLFEESAVSQMHIRRVFRTASLVTGSEARFGVKASEMSSAVNYDISRSWALPWWAYGFDGVWYKPGWDPRLAVSSLALFRGPGGDDDLFPSDELPGEDLITLYVQKFKTPVSGPISTDEADIS